MRSVDSTSTYFKMMFSHLVTSMCLFLMGSESSGQFVPHPLSVMPPSGPSLRLQNSMSQLPLPLPDGLPETPQLPIPGRKRRHSLTPFDDSLVLASSTRTKPSQLSQVPRLPDGLPQPPEIPEHGRRFSLLQLVPSFALPITRAETIRNKRSPVDDVKGKVTEKVGEKVGEGMGKMNDAKEKGEEMKEKAEEMKGKVPSSSLPSISPPGK